MLRWKEDIHVERALDLNRMRRIFGELQLDGTKFASLDQQFINNEVGFRYRGAVGLVPAVNTGTVHCKGHLTRLAHCLTQQAVMLGQAIGRCRLKRLQLSFPPRDTSVH